MHGGAVEKSYGKHYYFAGIGTVSYLLRHSADALTRQAELHRHRSVVFVRIACCGSES